MKIKLFSEETETSIVHERMSVYVRHLNLQHQPGMMEKKIYCSYLTKIYPNIKDNCIFKIDKLETTLFNDYGHTKDSDGVCIDWSLHLHNSANVQTTSLDSENATSVDGSKGRIFRKFWIYR